jgi:mono/diheme cytochrome c family protein
MKTMKTGLIAVLIVIAVLILGVAAFAFSGLYDVGADVPHTALVARLLEAARDRSTEAHANGIVVPKLDNPALIAEGAENYAEMCTGCHLAPGMQDTEIRKGLYPQPPNLALDGVDNPAEAFWIIKHGIKMTAMPAWGATHDDAKIWAMVAFLQKLPALSQSEYEKLAGSGDAETHQHQHDEK